MPTFKAERVQKSASFIVDAPVEKSFPLFGPIREKDWAVGWEPRMIYSVDPLIEEHMVFQTKGAHESEPEYTWALTQFRPMDYFVEYTVTTLNRVWFIRVKCEPLGNTTRVTVTYSYTGLTELGNELNKAAIESMYAHDLRDWEEAINHYLATGKLKH